MNKTSIKNYAIWARNTLIEAVKQRAFQYGITEQDCGDPMADSVNGFVLTAAEKKQRQALIAKIREKGYGQVCEEVAYTWFNRFIALRFMEVNGYLPSRVRVFTDEANAFKPQILSEATHLELDGLKLDRVIALKEANKTEELFKYLLITQCNALSAVLPGMFQKIEDYTELLLPDNLLREGSVIEQLVTAIPEEDWTDQVQIIGWLYQYYNTEPKDKVFADLKKNIKISKEKIPAATQLFTPDWIVRYMVENSLGRLWVEGHPNDELKASWRYYLEEAEQEPEVQAQLAEIRKGYATLNPEDLRVIDPCCGSGHILCYLFDVLMQIYEVSGYTARDAAQSILIHNLWGLDIDERAAQLSYFAVMMKARQYDRRFLSRNIQPHVYAIAESNNVSREAMEYFCKGDATLTKVIQTITTELHDAKEYGSILTCSKQDWEALYARFNEIYDDIALHREEALALLPLVQTAEALSRQYDVVVTNPPYMGGSGMSGKLSDYVKKNYSDSKSDLFAVFIERGNNMAKHNGMNSMVTMQSWMFLSSFEKMRSKIMASRTITNLMHMDNMVMHIAFGTAVSVFQNAIVRGYKGTYNQILIKDIVDDGDEHPKDFPVCGNRFAQISTDNFSRIPGSPVAYWASSNVLKAFNEKPFSYFAISNGQNITGNNAKYLRLFWEIDNNKINSEYWVKCARGGGFRKYHGNDDNVILWTEDARDHYKRDNISRIVPEWLRFRDGITWSYITSGTPSFRRLWSYELFEKAGTSVFFNNEEYINPLLGFLNSTVALAFLRIISPTLNYQVRDIFSLPVSERIIANSNVSRLVSQNINITRADWDAFETSWDFQRHPLLPFFADDPDESTQIEMWYRMWENQCQRRFDQLKANEKELNHIFIDIYGLQNELTPEVEDKDVTVRKADLTREVKSLISYAVGCMFGRYSIYKPGLLFAGEPYSLKSFVDKVNDQHGVISQEQLEQEYRTNGVIFHEMLEPDADNIIPICDDEYFKDDIVGRLIRFIEKVYGEETLEQNLRFIADALGGKGTPRDVIRSYFLNDFYADHLKIYQKRPIYWLFDSGKKNGFKCLIYMHRYQPDTIARIRTDYVHEQQSRYRTAIADLEQRVEIATPSERVILNKQLQKLHDQAVEVQKYEEKIHHLADQMISIDLDDGVKVNYAKFEDVLAKIK